MKMTDVFLNSQIEGFRQFPMEMTGLLTKNKKAFMIGGVVLVSVATAAAAAAAATAVGIYFLATHLNKKSDEDQMADELRSEYDARMEAIEGEENEAFINGMAAELKADWIARLALEQEDYENEMSADLKADWEAAGLASEDLEDQYQGRFDLKMKAVKTDADNAAIQNLTNDIHSKLAVFSKESLEARREELRAIEDRALTDIEAQELTTLIEELHIRSTAEGLADVTDSE